MIHYLLIALLFQDASAETKNEKQNVELKIVADEMECDQKEQKCVATGNALAENLNDPNNRTLKANRFVAYFADKGTKIKDESDRQKKGDKSKIKKLEAIGNVIITDNDTIILCDRAEYLIENDRIELFNNVKITNGRNQLEGSHGTANLKDHKYKIINTGKQVQALIVNTPKNKDKKSS